MAGNGIRRLGVLTGGGDAPGLNAVIRAVAKTALFRYGWSVIGFEDGFEGLLSGTYRELDFDAVRGILPLGGTILGTSNRCNPFLYADEGESALRDRSDEVIDRLRELNIDAMVMIGGDGTLSIAREFAQRGVRLIGVPKTIDNDVRGTQVTFGFDTAVTTATEALDKLHTTAESHHRSMVVEVMGRTAGWLALYAGVAGGADVVLLPEIPFELEYVREMSAYRASHGRHFTIIVVAEGAFPAGGEAIYEVIGPRQYDRRFGGIGEWLRKRLAEESRQEVRAVVLGHLQRGGGPTARDRLLSTLFGSTAVDMLAGGLSGQMVGIESEAAGPGRPSVVPVPLSEPSRGPRLVPANHPLLRAAREMGISFGDRMPARPASETRP